jgi:hypothetical protein
MNSVISTTPEIADIQALIDLTRGMTAIVVQETDLLRQHRINDILPLQEPKNRAFQAYEAGIIKIQEAPEVLQALDPELKDSLRETLASFQEASESNRQALKAARDSRRFVLAAIREAVQDQQQQITPYNRTGRTQASVYGRAGGGTAAVAVSQTL